MICRPAPLQYLTMDGLASRASLAPHVRSDTYAIEVENRNCMTAAAWCVKFVTQAFRIAWYVIVRTDNGFGSLGGCERATAVDRGEVRGI